MRLVHLADLHLGFTRFSRIAAPGSLGSEYASIDMYGNTNQREADVATSFLWVIDRTLTLAPDVIVIAGDVFHEFDPRNSTRLLAQRAFSNLRRALPSAVIVMIAGNHDLGADICVLRLLEDFGVVVVDRKPERMSFFDGALSILAVPEMKKPALPSFEPNPAAQYNVLLFHGEITGVIAQGRGQGHSKNVVSPEELQPARWDYIALGHYHVTHEVAPNAWYAGSIDYTSTDPWTEMTRERALGLAGKGIIERDLATGAHVIHPIPRSRVHIDMTPIGAHGKSVEDLNTEIAAAIDATPIDDAVVRLKVLDIDPLVSNALDHAMIRRAKAHALNFNFDQRKLERRAPHMNEIALQMREAAGRIAGEAKAPLPRTRGLQQVVSAHLSSCELPVDIDRAGFVAVGLDYLQKAKAKDEMEPAPEDEAVAA